MLRRQWVVLVIGSMLFVGGDALAASKSSNSSKAGGGSKSFKAQIEEKLDAEFGPKDAPPVKYENAEHKLRFTAPGYWKAASGGCVGSIYNLMIRPDIPTPKSGESVSIRGDIFTVAANPLKSPSAGLDDAVKDVQAELKKTYPKVEFKPIEKTTVAGTEAQVVTALMPAKESKEPKESKGSKEPKQAERHVVFVRDGKVYQMILYAQPSTLAKQAKAVQAIAKSFEWTGGGSDETAAAAPAKAKPGNNDGFDD